MFGNGDVHITKSIPLVFGDTPFTVLHGKYQKVANGYKW
jgi:hypothetical protein